MKMVIWLLDSGTQIHYVIILPKDVVIPTYLYCYSSLKIVFSIWILNFKILTVLFSSYNVLHYITTYKCLLGTFDILMFLKIVLFFLAKSWWKWKGVFKMFAKIQAFWSLKWHMMWRWSKWRSHWGWSNSSRIMVTEKWKWTIQNSVKEYLYLII